MIEAVENHNPEVIVIDEIGRELEAQAARTIAERGVQLIGTAHGQTLDNLLLNPTLSDLIGGIESVTLSDEEARRRGTQKVVLERRSPPTFDVLVELQTRHHLVVHEDIAAAVDARLRGRPLPVEVRYRNAEGEVVIETQQPMTTGPDRSTKRSNGTGPAFQIERGGSRRDNREGREERDRGAVNDLRGERRGENRNGQSAPRAESTEGAKSHQPLHLYAYGVARNRLLQAAKRMRLPLIVEEEFENSQAVVTLKSYYRRRPKLIIDAENRGVPVYVLRANTLTQMEDFLADAFGLEAVDPPDPFAEAIHETEAAIERIRSGARLVDLTPATSPIRKVQHDMAREANLVSHSYGQEPRRRVRIFRDVRETGRSDAASE